MTVSMVFARSLVAEFARRELDVERLLSASGVSRMRLASGLPMLGYEEACRLAREAVALSDDEGIGHEAGLGAPTTAFHVVSLLLLSQPTLRQSIKAFESVSRLVCEGPRFALTENDETASFEFRSITPPSDDKRVIYDFGIAFTARIGSTFVPLRESETERALTQVHLQHARPSYASRYEEAYGCPVLFSQPSNALVFRRELLDRQSAHADLVLSEVAHTWARQALRATENTRGWKERVRFVLENTDDLSSLDATSLARRLYTSERTLRRKLVGEASSWRTLLDEARCRRAMDALQDAHVPIRDIGARLGFSSMSAFSRAFRHWAGRSPSAFRRAVKQHTLHTA